MYKGVRFLALADGQEVGRCECQIDLTHGGALPALAGWAELCELQVDAASRNQGIGSWLVRQAAAWLRTGSCDRVVLATERANAGAWRFYERLGWQAPVREQRGWQLPMQALVSSPPPGMA